MAQMAGLEPSESMIAPETDSTQASLQQEASSHILAHTVPPHLNNQNVGNDGYRLNLASSMTSPPLCEFQVETEGSQERDGYDLTGMAR